MKIADFILKIFAWTWFVIGSLFAVVAFGDGRVVSGVAIVASALFALPPLWQKLAEKNFGLAISYRFAGGIIAFFFGMAIHMNATNSELREQKAAERNVSNEERLASRADPVSKTEKVPAEVRLLLDELEKKIAPHAVIVMKSGDYPKLYSKIGKAKFDRANDLARWAALSAALSTKCNKVDLVAVSEKSSRKNVEWFVDCENGERFEINETGAEETQRQLTLKGSETAKAARELESKREVQPNSAATDKLSIEDEAVIVGSCDRAIGSVKQSYDPAWSYKYRKHSQRGRISVTRDFEYQNAFGGTISSQYECLVDAKNKDLISLRIREPTGWKTLYSK